jgi:hypothetical protein
MNASIKKLIAENPNGLLELKPSLSIPEYKDAMGFNLKETEPIYKSKKLTLSDEPWFKFPKSSNKTLEELFTVQEESDGDLLVVFIVEVIIANRVYCYLVLSDEAFRNILCDPRQHVLQVHQMYSQWLERDHIALNMQVA